MTLKYVYEVIPRMAETIASVDDPRACREIAEQALYNAFVAGIMAERERSKALGNPHTLEDEKLT